MAARRVRMCAYTRRTLEGEARTETKQHVRIGSPCARALQQAQRRWLPNVTDCSPTLHTCSREARGRVKGCLVRVSDDELPATKQLVVGVCECLVGILFVTNKTAVGSVQVCRQQFTELPRPPGWTAHGHGSVTRARPCRRVCVW